MLENCRMLSGQTWWWETPGDPILTRTPHIHVFYLWKTHQVVMIKIWENPFLFLAGREVTIWKFSHNKNLLSKRNWRKPTSVFLPGEFHRQKEPGGPQPMGSQRVGPTEWLILSLSLFLKEAGPPEPFSNLRMLVSQSCPGLCDHHGQ